MNHRLILSLAAAIAALPSFACAQMPGRLEWSIDHGERPSDGKVQFTLMHRDGRNQSIDSHPVDLATLNGLSPDQLRGRRGPVHFTIKEDAGTLDCSGTAGSGEGDGSCSFAGNQGFVAELERQGFGRADEQQLFSLTMMDIGLPMFAEVARQGYRGASVADVIRLREHGVGLDMLREVGALGYKLPTLGALADLRDHGVTTDYIRAVMANGLGKLSPEELIDLRDHGVMPDYVAQVRRNGLPNADVRALIDMRDHGVSAAFVRALAASGRRFSAAEVVRMRDHGLNADFVGQLKTVG